MRLMRGRRGQAMTEVVLLFPLLVLVMFLMAKIFAILVLVQKLEIASYYAARKWQLESHRNAEYISDDNQLAKRIRKNVAAYLGYNDNSIRKFLNLKGGAPIFDPPERTQVWNVVTLTVNTSAEGNDFRTFVCKYNKNTVCASPYGSYCVQGYDFLCGGAQKFTVIKYVPNRDRPIKFELPGSAE